MIFSDFQKHQVHVWYIYMHLSKMHTNINKPKSFKSIFFTWSTIHKWISLLTYLFQISTYLNKKENTIIIYYLIKFPK